MEVFSHNVCRRKRIRKGRVVISRFWYGRKRSSAAKSWTYIKLYRDRRSSQTAWEDYRTRAERMDAGVISIESERLKLPLREIIDTYEAHLRRKNRDPRHVKISKWMLLRAAKLGNWVSWSDLNLANIETLLDDLEAADATASYRNKFVARLKAFVSWALPEGWANPLAKLSRISERNAKRKRGRRAATNTELSAIVLRSDLEEYRRVAYALAAYNGLRRNEAARLDWSSIDHEEKTIRIRQKMGDGYDTIPIHPYVYSLLTADGKTTQESGRVLRAVPDLKTLVKDLERVGVPFSDRDGNRLDYHALRHTFATALSRAGASSATRKRLMRHLHETVTDRYTHADLAEMAAALAKIPWPSAAKSGHRLDHPEPRKIAFSGAFTTSFPQNWTENMHTATVSLAGPDTQVGEGDTGFSPEKSPENLKGTHERTTTRAALRKRKRRLGLLRAFIRASERREEGAE